MVDIPDATYDWRGLSIKQPAASLIIEGFKTVENRSISQFKHDRLMGKWILIHSSVSSTESPEKIRRYPGTYVSKIGMDLPMGHIIGIARIGGVYTKDELPAEHRQWGNDGCACILFDVIIKLNRPIKTTGELGLWKMKLPAKWNPPRKLSKKEENMSEQQLSQWRNEQETKYIRKKFERSVSLFRVLLLMRENAYTVTHLQNRS